MLTELLSKISDRFSERRQVIAEDFETLVLRIVISEDSDVEPEQVAELLESLNRTAEDLAAAVGLVIVYRDYAALVTEAGLNERCKCPPLSLPAGELRSQTDLFQQRIELLKVIQVQPELADEIEAVGKELAAESKRFLAAQTRWLEKKKALDVTSTRLEHKLRSIESSITKLFKVRIPSPQETELLERRAEALRMQPDRVMTFGKPSANVTALIARLTEEIAAEQASHMEPATSPVFATDATRARDY